MLVEPNSMLIIILIFFFVILGGLSPFCVSKFSSLELQTQTNYQSLQEFKPKHNENKAISVNCSHFHICVHVFMCATLLVVIMLGVDLVMHINIHFKLETPLDASLQGTHHKINTYLDSKTPWHCTSIQHTIQQEWTLRFEGLAYLKISSL